MLALENMWRKNTRTVAFQHERTNVYSICYFGYLIRFPHFMILVEAAFPPLTTRHWFFIIQIFEQLALALKNRVCPELFHCVEIFFYLSGFWPNWTCPENRVRPEFLTVLIILFAFRIFEQLALALKNRVCPEFLTVLKCSLSFRIFYQLGACPENRVCPEIFHCIEYIFYHSLDFWATLRLPWKTECALKILTVLNILFTFRIFQQLVLALKKQSVPWISIEYTVFIIQNFEQLALVLENRVCPDNFPFIEIFFIFQDFFINVRLPWKTECALNSLY